MILTVLVVRSPAPTQAAQFVISSASWSYPDEYGQGIQYLSVYNSTGDWIDTIGYNVTGSWLYEQDVFEIPFNETLTIAVYSWLNKTQLGLSSFEDGKNFLRHSITVSYPSTTVFTQQNFTYETGTDANDPMYFYKHNITLSCFNTHGVIYTVETALEIFMSDPYSDPYLATDGEGTPPPTGDYTDTHVKEGSSMFTLDASGPYDASITLEFAIPEEDIESVKLNFYGYTFTGDLSATTKELLVYNGTHWIDFGDIAENAFGWTNITFDSTYIVSPFHTIYMKAHVADDSMITLLIDYAEVRFINPPVWQELGVAELIFHVGWDPVFQFGYDTFFIFLGLIMIVASTMYLVRGGKDELSSNKFFYFVILFIMGWALFVGGIMP